MSGYVWRTYRIGELGKVITGRTPPSSKPECFGETYPFITPSDMTGQKWIDVTDRYLSEQGATLLKRNLVPKGSVAVSCIGWQMGKAVMVRRPSFTNQQLNTIVPNKTVDPNFLYYSLVPRKNELLSLGSAIGVRTPILNKSAFSDLEVRLPSLPIQQKIASILSAYDDLIENNLRRIKILEEMAQNLYREWFVKFRFPGHEQVWMVDSPLGKIPEGWNAKSLADLSLYISRGVSPKYDNSSPSLVVNQKCIRNNHLNLELARRHRSKVTPEKFLRFGDVLINSTGVGTLGRVAQVYEDLEDCTVDTHVSIVRPKEEINEDFFGLTLINLERHFESLGAGATGQTELRRDRIGEAELFCPPKGVQEYFGKIVSPIRRLMIILLRKNKNLAQTRDLLLPKLISGELDVSQLNTAIKEEAA